MSDKSREELEERVDELEATVKKMLPSRRQVLKSGATVAGAGALGFTAGNASAQASTEDGDGNVGDPDDRVDVFADGVSAARLGNGPMAFSSEYDTIQAALDAAAGGHLLIDDTKREEGIQISDTHEGTTIEWVGDNWIDKPANPTDGEATIRLADDLTDDVEDVTFIRPQIRNPDFSDGDIDNNDTRASGDRRDGIETHPPNGISQGDASPVRWTVIDPHIHHIQGNGCSIKQPKESLRVDGGEIYRVAGDCYGTRTSASITGVEGVTIQFDTIHAGWAGRHNCVSSGDAIEGVVRVTGRGEDAYLSGFDTEESQNIQLDYTVERPGRKGNPGAGTNSGLNISGDSGKVSGEIRINDPNVFGANISSGDLDDLTVIVYQSSTQNPANVEEISVEADVTGKMTAKVFGGGSEDVGSIRADAVAPGFELDAHVEDSFGPSLCLVRTPKAQVHLTSIDPVQDTDAPGTPNHVLLHDVGGTGTTNCSIEIQAIDNDGNVTDAVAADGNSDWNRISGNIRNAYSNSATSGLGSNSDATDLIG